MTVYAGNDGVVKVGATPSSVTKITEFEIEESADTDRTDGMGDAWQEHVVTKKSWSGSMTCERNYADTNGQVAITNGSSLAAEFYPDGDATGREKLSGTVIVTGVTTTAQQDASNQVSFTFMGNGALARAAVSS